MGDNHTERQTTEQSVREQYHRETEEIHAPADLINRTKDAVREEEQRIAQNRAAQEQTVPQISGQQKSGSARAGHVYSRMQRLALPAAAAVLVLLVGASGLFFGRGKRSEEFAADATAQETDTADYDSDGIAPSATTEDYNLDGAAAGVTTEAEKQAQFEKHLQNIEAAESAEADTAESATDGETQEDTLYNAENGMADTTADSGRATDDMTARKEAATDSATAVTPALQSVTFYDKDKKIVEAEALWYNAARIDSIQLRWEGGTPVDIKVFRTPAGSGTAEQTELLLTKSIPDGDESVLLDADILHDGGVNSHLFFELDFGTQVVKSEEYNLLYDKN